MKKIDKEDSPEWFETWKRDFRITNGREARYKNDFSTDDLDGKTRRQRLRGQLIREQGCICCYCMKKVSLNSSHIEHFYSNKDDGMYVPYCMAIVDCLKACLSK